MTSPLAVKAMADYHWSRYAARAEGGTLSSPAVFTTHTWQDVQNVIRALPATDARADALREAAAAVRARYMGDNNREDMEVLRCEAAIRALIPQSGTDALRPERGEGIKLALEEIRSASDTEICIDRLEYLIAREGGR